MNWTLTPAGSLLKKKRTDDMGETYVSKGAKPNAIKISVLKNTREEMPAVGGHFHTARLIDMKK